MSDFQRHSWKWSEVSPPPQVEGPRSLGVLARFLPLLIVGILFWLSRPILASVVLTGYALYLVLLFAAPAILQLISGLITHAARWLSRLVGNLGFALLYIVVFTPIALLSRRRDPLHLSWSPSEGSYWLASPGGDPLRLQETWKTSLTIPRLSRSPSSRGWGLPVTSLVLLTYVPFSAPTSSVMA